MPLPFLTADRHLDDPGAPPAAENPPLPGEDRDTWRRPYRPGPVRVAGGALLLLLAAYLLICALTVAVAGAVGAASGFLAGAAALIALAVRLLGAGVRVSGRGLRHAGLFRTVTWPWAEVGRVRTVQQPVRWLGLPRTVQGQALVMTPAGDGRPARVLLTDHNADFLTGTRGFARATDVIEGWAAEASRK